MPEPAGGAIVASLGIQLQLAASVLCLGLGLLVARGLGHRPWVTWWTWSFGAVGLAVFALLIRYNGLPLGALAQPDTHLVSLLYAIYGGGKLLFFMCLLSGTWLYVTRKNIPAVGLGAGLALLLAVALLFYLAPTDLNPFMAWQAGFAVPVFVICALLLRTLPARRKSRGSRALKWVCFALAALWLLYIPAFLQASPDSSPVPGFLGWLTRYNSYVDTLFQFLLGFGMILAVLDDVYGEAEAARQARLNELADSEARLAQIIRAASDGIVLLDAERRIIHCNPAALAILGCPADAVMGQPFDRFARGTDLAELWKPLADPSDGHPSTPAGGYEIKGLRADGGEFPMEISLRAIGMAAPEGYVLILRD
ncbi:MAG TPA: PAS domain S-box protein, partial [Gemmatimonadales bacterium]|nr:PAS domain S-box protein [Gemmatimonadales bacterium]